jgi:cell division protein FtsQ
VSEQGKLFPTPKKLADLALPELDGPTARPQEVMKLYSDSRALFAPAGVDVRRVTMDARGSWSLVLSNGTEVVVGRDDARSRMQRFVKVLPQLNRQDAPIERADLRYTNGFTLSWGTPATPAKTPATPARRRRKGHESQG